MLILALTLLLTSCSPRNVESGGSSSPVDASIGSDSEMSKSASTVQYTSKLGCSVTYDPNLFVVKDIEDENLKHTACFAVESIWEDRNFTLNIMVTPLDFPSVEGAVNDMVNGSRNVDGSGEEVSFGRYTATRLTYNEVYAVGEIYVMEQSGNVFSVEISSYYQPSEELLASAYAILDSVIF